MAKKMKVDNHFTPCPVTDGEELYLNGIFEFNITKMVEYIQDNTDDFSLEQIAVSDISEYFSSINEYHLDSVEISQPVIMAEISPGRFSLIDGNHRMEKAHRTGIRSMPAYRLSAEQHIRFLTDKKAYVAYIAYWNSKLK